MKQFNVAFIDKAQDRHAVKTISASNEEQALELAEYWLACNAPNLYELFRDGTRECWEVK